MRVDRRHHGGDQHGRRDHRPLSAPTRSSAEARPQARLRRIRRRMRSRSPSPRPAAIPVACARPRRRPPTAWCLDGRKQWITSGAHAGVLVVWARTARGRPGTKGISCFLVERGTPGMNVGPAEEKMGLRGSNTVPLTFDDCRVPRRRAARRAAGSGFAIAMMALDGGRIGIASQAHRHRARRRSKRRLTYAKDRQQFGQPIGEFQAIQWHARRRADRARRRAPAHACAPRR